MALPTHYESLGVAPGASPAEIRKAHEKWVREFAKETTAPDSNRERRVADAFAALSDPQRRDAYDAELAAARSARVKGKFPVVPISAGALVAIGLGAYFALKPAAPPPGPKGKPAQEILSDASGSIAPLVSIDMSGKTTSVGLAFAIEDKVIVAACQAIAPGATFMLTHGPRSVPARVTLADPELGLCMLATEGYAGLPLGLSSVEPKPGDKVYVTRLSSKNEVVIAEGTVKKVHAEAKGKSIESSVGVPQGSNGAPMLDAAGRVVGVSIVNAAGEARHRAVPPMWLSENRPKEAPPPMRAPDPPPEAAPGSTSDPSRPPSEDELLDKRAAAGRKALDKMSPEQRKRLEDAWKGTREGVPKGL